MAINNLDQKNFWDQYKGAMANASEFGFYDDIATEIFNIYGIPTEWYPVEVDVANPQNRVFGEDPNKKYPRKVMVTAIIEGGSIQENVLFNQYGMLNKVEFTMHLHQQSFRDTVGRKPLPSDQFTFVKDLTTQVFEVMHVTESTLGVQGNIFGHRTTYTVIAKEREISPAEIGDGERYGHTDSEGNVLPNAPADLENVDGEIKEKYKVPGLTKDNRDGAYHGDNEAVQEIADGVDEHGNPVMPGGRGIISRSGKDKPDWGSW
jgi:hypothetical protein